MGLDISLEKIGDDQKFTYNDIEQLREVNLKLFTKEDFKKLLVHYKKEKEFYEATNIDYFMHNVKAYVNIEKYKSFRSESYMLRNIYWSSSSDILFEIQENFLEGDIELETNISVNRMSNINIKAFIFYDFSKYINDLNKNQKLFVKYIWNKINWDWNDPFVLNPSFIATAYDIIKNVVKDEEILKQTVSIHGNVENIKTLEDLIKHCIDEELSLVAG